MSNSKTDTPRTDAIANVEYVSQFEYSRAMTRHARELERELIAAIIRVGTIAVRSQPVADIQMAAQKKKWIDPYQEGLNKLSNEEVMVKLRKHGCIGVKRIDEAGASI